MIYPIAYLVRRCNFTWEVGELALITDYWNEAKFKHKHPVANLPASHHGILIYFRFQWFVHKELFLVYWCRNHVSKNIYIIITPKYILKEEKKIIRKKGYGCGDRTRDPWVRSPATYPLSHRLLGKWDRYWLYKTLVRNDNSLIPLGVKAVVLETCLNPPRGRGKKLNGTLAGEDDLAQFGKR